MTARSLLSGSSMFANMRDDHLGAGELVEAETTGEYGSAYVTYSNAETGRTAEQMRLPEGYLLFECFTVTADGAHSGVGLPVSDKNARAWVMNEHRDLPGTITRDSSQEDIEDMLRTVVYYSNISGAQIRWVDGQFDDPRATWSEFIVRDPTSKVAVRVHVAPIIGRAHYKNFHVIVENEDATLRHLALKTSDRAPFHFEFDGTTERSYAQYVAQQVLKAC